MGHCWCLPFPQILWVKQRVSKLNISNALYGTGWKTAGRDQSSAFFMYSSIVLYEVMCRFCLASLPKESQQSMCFWGGSGENLAHRAVINEAWEVIVPERAIDMPSRIHHSPKTRLDPWGKQKKKVLESFWYFISYNSFVISLFLHPGKWSFIKCWSSLHQENGILPPRMEPRTL